MSRTIVSIDIASSKVVCLIARLDNKNRLCIKGASLLESNGIQNGNIINTKLTTQAIVKTVSKAEKMFGKNVDNVSININGNKLKSRTLITRQNFKINKKVTKSLLLSMSDDIIKGLSKDNKKVIHLVPLEFNLNGINTSNPIGMQTKSMNTKLHVFFTDKNKIDNISNCFKKISLSVKNVIFDGFASALSVLNDYEIGSGTLVIDIGAGTSSFSIVNNNRFIFGNSIPIAGDIITNDISSVLGVSSMVAEKVKIMNTNLYLDHTEEAEMIKIDIDGEETYRAAENKKKIINDIFRSRVDEIIEIIFGILDKKRLINSFGSIVLTGGTANVPGLDNYISKTFRIKSRIGRPENFDIAQEIDENEIRNPSYATSIGILNFIKYFNEKKDFEDYNNGIGGISGKIISFLSKVFTS